MSDAEHFRVALEACEKANRELRLQVTHAEDVLAGEGFAKCSVCHNWFRPFGPEGIGLPLSGPHAMPRALHYSCVPDALQVHPREGDTLGEILRRDIILARVTSGIIRRRWGQIPRDWPEDVRTAVAEKIEALRAEPTAAREDE